MDREAFDWSLLRSFLAVFDAGSVSAAARATGARQPTLSRHVAELESQLGAPLFERTGRGIMPTPLASSVADAARRMAEAADAVGHSVMRQRQTASGSVRVTTSDVAANYLLPPVLARLVEAEPGIQIDLVASNDLSNLLRREADIAVRMVRPAQGSLVAKKIADIEIVACAHRDYLARAGTPRVPQDLLAHRLIGFDRNEAIQQASARLGFVLTRESFALRTDDQLAYLRLVAAAGGVGFATRYSLRQLPGVVPLLPQMKIPPLPCWLAVHREIRSNRIVRRVYDFLAEALPVELAAPA